MPNPSKSKSDLSVLTARTRLPAELSNANSMQKLDWILGLPQPEEFVAALAPDELYYWMRDIGKEDAFPLLEYAKPEQLQALVDIDAWSRHELSVPRWLEWLDLAVAVDEDTAQRFITSQDDELLLALMTGDVQVLERDTDTSAIPDELQFFNSPDFLYIVTVPRDHPLEERLPQIMRMLWAADTDRARELFQQAQFELHEANAEDMERFRTARLQDLGFESMTDAMEVFSTVPLVAMRKELEQVSEVSSHARGSGASGMVSDIVLKDVHAPDLLRAAVSALDEGDRRSFGDGFAYLANKVFMAETGDLSKLENLPEIANFAAATTNLGLSYLAAESEERAAEIVRQVTPEMVFRAGWTQLFELSRKARRLATRAGQDRGFTLFGTPTDEVVHATSQLRPRFPQCLDEAGRLDTRPIATLEDISRVEAYVDEARLVLDAFEQHFGLTLKALEQGDLPGLSADARKNIRLTTLVRTGLLHSLLRNEFSFMPVAREEIVAFSRAAFGKDHSRTPAFEARIELVARTVDGSPETRQAFADLVARSVDELTETLGPVHERDIDLRFVGDVFLVATE